ncbi:hypothetical protein Leryth_027130 [Lithospermum erythrorhizon]|nr:hypothetical protein Leryth_027130 [Lithospermum erythrorhizon]
MIDKITVYSNIMILPSVIFSSFISYSFSNSNSTGLSFP